MSIVFRRPLFCIACAGERDEALQQAEEAQVQVARVKIEYDARLQTTLAELQETIEALSGAEASIAQLVHENGDLRARLDAQTAEHVGQHSAVVRELDSERERLAQETRRLQELLTAAEGRATQAATGERVANDMLEQARDESRQAAQALASKDAEIERLKGELQALKGRDQAIERSSSAGSLASDSNMDLQWARREAEYASLVNALKHRVCLPACT